MKPGPTIIDVVLNTDMRMQHSGLADVMKRKRIKLNRDNQFVVFVNRARTRAKMLNRSGVMIYVARDDGIEEQDIVVLPKLFGGSEFRRMSAVEWKEAA
jgi:hypothetical protein